MTKLDWASCDCCFCFSFVLGNRCGVSNGMVATVAISVDLSIDSIFMVALHLSMMMMMMLARRLMRFW